MKMKTEYFFILLLAGLFTASYFLDLISRRKIEDLIRRESGLSDMKVKEITNSVLFWSLKLDIDPLLILAIIKKESNYNQYAIGVDGEKGLMQVMPIALTEVSRVYKIPEKPDMLFDVDYNIMIGTHYLKYCYSKAKTWSLALVYYNDGWRIRDKGLRYMSAVMDIYNNYKKVI